MKKIACLLGAAVLGIGAVAAFGQQGRIGPFTAQQMNDGRTAYGANCAMCHQANLSGGNDALRGLALQSTQGNLQAMVKMARESGARILLVGMQVPPNYGAAYTQQFADMFTQIAAKEKLPLVPFLLSGIGDARDSDQWFQPDRIHPNAKAQPHMLENVWPQLRPLLK